MPKHLSLRRITAAAVCTVAIAGCSSSDDSAPPAIATSFSEPSAGAAQRLAVASVTELATPPNGLIPGSKLFATERGLVLWGVRDSASGQVTAARYSVQDNKWTRLDFPTMSRPPNESGLDVSVVATGTELLILGRENLSLDLSTGKWHQVAEMPRPFPTSAFAFWTGSQAVVIGGSTPPAPAETPFVGQAFDPIANSWRAIATPPEKIRLVNGSLTSGAVLWTGKEALVFASRDDVTTPSTVLFLTYDPATDKWRVESSPLDGGMPETGATDGRTAYWVHKLTAAAGLDLDTRQRIEVPSLPIQNESRLALVDGQLVGLYGSAPLVVFDAGTKHWLGGSSISGKIAVVDGRTLYVIDNSNAKPRFSRVISG
ncbi:MAG: hypothetical protein ABI658_05325 [Acidimicrobiales bacterium]